MKFRTTTEFEAFRYGIDDRPDWFMDEVSANRIITFRDGCLLHKRLVAAKVGDYIVYDAAGCIYSVPAAQFDKIAVKVEEEPAKCEPCELCNSTPCRCVPQTKWPMFLLECLSTPRWSDQVAFNAYRDNLQLAANEIIQLREWQKEQTTAVKADRSR